MGPHEVTNIFNQIQRFIKSMKHNYPKNRKLPDNTLKADLLKRHDLDEIQKVWYDQGMYKTADLLDTSPSIIHYLAVLNSWKRPLPVHLVKAYRDKTWTNLKTNFIPENSNQNNKHAN